MLHKYQRQLTFSTYPDITVTGGVVDEKENCFQCPRASSESALNVNSFKVGFTLSVADGRQVLVSTLDKSK